MSQNPDILQPSSGNAGTRARGLERANTRTLWSRARRLIASSTSGKIGLALVALVIICALFAPLLAPHDPYEMHQNHRMLGPSTFYPLGTDEFGRDILSRIIYGSRISL